MVVTYKTNPSKIWGWNTEIDQDNADRTNVVRVQQAAVSSLVVIHHVVQLRPDQSHSNTGSHPVPEAEKASIAVTLDVQRSHLL
jgi:hypothetical protein